uniref:PHB domain-containing protein n=1 Tax=Panagrellus redivivus TaxID=6233 RepID=A0A7E4WCL3_PANRE
MVDKYDSFFHVLRSPRYASSLLVFSMSETVELEPLQSEPVMANPEAETSTVSITMPSANADPVPNADFLSRLMIGFSYFVITISFPVSLWFCFRVIREYERGVWLRLGRLAQKDPVRPGLQFVIPWIDQIRIVDMRVKTLNVMPQAILTRDSVTVSVDAVIYTRVMNPTSSVLNVTHEKYATELLGQTTLRNILGTMTLAEILAERERIASHMRAVLDEATDAWGVKIERVEVKDVSLPTALQRSMAAIAEAEREAKARIIAAESEKAASVALKAAALEMADTPTAFQLRYLQTLNTISAENSSTIVFPIPIELLSIFKP